MVRLIDADKLVNELHEYFSNGFDGDEWWNSTHVLAAIEQTHTVDAVPVEWMEKIRCRDCIHHHGHDCENMNYRWTSDDFYCGWAERKEE